MARADSVDYGARDPVSSDAFAGAMAPFGLRSDNGPLAIAVSGGPDSMALVRLAQCWAQEHGIVLVGLTVDHGLRDESAEEARRVQGWLSALGVSHHTLMWEEGRAVRHIERSVQADARDGRFKLMAALCAAQGAQALMTAHHADDQVETFFDRLLRGSGVDGLAAIASDAMRDGLRVLRPLLAFDKQSLVATCEAHGQPWITDPSNSDETYKRVRLRRLISELDKEGLDRNRLLKTVAHMRRAKSAIDHAVDDLSKQAVIRADDEGRDLNLDVVLRAPQEVGLRFLARTLADVSGEIYPPRFESLERVYDALGATNWSDRTLHGCLLQKRNGRLRVVREPGRL